MSEINKIKLACFNSYSPSTAIYLKYTYIVMNYKNSLIRKPKVLLKLNFNLSQVRSSDPI